MKFPRTLKLISHVNPHLILSTDWSFFAVFDGHCGSTVSTHCADNLLPTIIDTEDFKKISPKTSESDEANNETESIIRKAIHAGFLKYDIVL